MMRSCKWTQNILLLPTTRIPCQYSICVSRWRKGELNGQTMQMDPEGGLSCCCQQHSVLSISDLPTWSLCFNRYLSPDPVQTGSQASWALWTLVCLRFRRRSERCALSDVEEEWYWRSRSPRVFPLTFRLRWVRMQACRIPGYHRLPSIARPFFGPHLHCKAPLSVMDLTLSECLDLLIWARDYEVLLCSGHFALLLLPVLPHLRRLDVEAALTAVCRVQQILPLSQISHHLVAVHPLWERKLDDKSVGAQRSSKAKILDLPPLSPMESSAESMPPPCHPSADGSRAPLAPSRGASISH